MAVFGAPVAHEDDAERAVRAGLRVLEAIAELNGTQPSTCTCVSASTPARRWSRSALARARRGVRRRRRRQHRGPPAVSRAGGRESRSQRRPTGRPSACSTTSHSSRSRPRARRSRVPLWRALRPRARFGADVTRSRDPAGRSGRRQGGVDSPASTGLPRALVAAGHGRRRARRRQEPARRRAVLATSTQRPGLVLWRQGRCLPYGDGIAFWALGEIVKAHAGIFESDSPAQAAPPSSTGRACPRSTTGRGCARRIGPLVGVSGAAAARDESFTAWRRFLERLAADGPCVLVIEDLHWADVALLAFLEHLADWAQDVPLLVLCTTRPELYERIRMFGSHARNAQTHHAGAALGRGRRRSCSRCCSNGPSCPSTLERTLLERAEREPALRGGVRAAALPTATCSRRCRTS